MQLPKGWPNVKLPKGWPEPNFHPQLVEAAQDPLLRDKVISLEVTIQKELEKSSIGAVIELPYIHRPDLRQLRCKIARRYGLRREKNSTTRFCTKGFQPQDYILADIPEVEDNPSMQPLSPELLPQPRPEATQLSSTSVGFQNEGAFNFSHSTEDRKSGRSERLGRNAK